MTPTLKNKKKVVAVKLPSLVSNSKTKNITQRKNNHLVLSHPKSVNAKQVEEFSLSNVGKTVIQPIHININANFDETALRQYIHYGEDHLPLDVNDVVVDEELPIIKHSGWYGIDLNEPEEVEPTESDVESLLLLSQPDSTHEYSQSRKRLQDRKDMNDLVNSIFTTATLQSITDGDQDFDHEIKAKIDSDSQQQANVINQTIKSQQALLIQERNQRKKDLDQIIKQYQKEVEAEAERARKAAADAAEAAAAAAAALAKQNEPPPPAPAPVQPTPQPKQEPISKPQPELKIEPKPLLTTFNNNPLPQQPITINTTTPPIAAVTTTTTTTNQNVEAGPPRKVIQLPDPKSYMISAPSYIDAQQKLAVLRRTEESASKIIDKSEPKVQITRKMNRTTGQISLSYPAMNKLIGDISVFLKSLPADASTGQNINLDFALKVLSEKLTTQAGSVGAREGYKFVYPAAILCVELSLSFPKFLKVVLGMIHSKCPYTIPMYTLRLPGESEASYKQRQSYKVDAANNLEATDLFEDRMNGLLAFYAAITQTDDPSPQAKNPYGADKAWQWLATVLNMKPTTEAIECLALFLELTSYRLMTVYKAQFNKLIKFAQEKYLPQTRQLKGAASGIAKLELVIMRFTKNSASDPIKLPTRDLDTTSDGNFVTPIN
ncbi:nucleoporin GLE1 [Acrasis kona]|uniref:mRNA export factor GLE1 n=1 Tax=Acrasis kona TaxID=1008807 RepID=A0AAW2ZDW6_9EUKA